MVIGLGCLAATFVLIGGIICLIVYGAVVAAFIKNKKYFHKNYYYFSNL